MIIRHCLILIYHRRNCFLWLLGMLVNVIVFVNDTNKIYFRCFVGLTMMTSTIQ